jgi:hypothetical protein
MRLTVSITGLSELDLKVRYMREAAISGLKLSVPEAAQLFVEEAKVLVPVDTGRLQEAIHAESLEDSDYRQTMQVAPFVEAGNDWGFDPAYARRIEYGFFGTDKLGRNYHQAAQPYMRPAYDAKQTEAAEVIKSGVSESLYGVMGRA